MTNNVGSRLLAEAMATVTDDTSFGAMFSLLLILILNCHRAVAASMEENEGLEEEAACEDVQMLLSVQPLDSSDHSSQVLNQYRLWANLLAFDEDLGF